VKIGIILGTILGFILIIVGGIAFFSASRRNEKCKWCIWVLLAGMCALITAGANALKHLLILAGMR